MNTQLHLKTFFSTSTGCKRSLLFQGVFFCFRHFQIKPQTRRFLVFLFAQLKRNDEQSNVCRNIFVSLWAHTSKSKQIYIFWRWQESFAESKRREEQNKHKVTNFLWVFFFCHCFFHCRYRRDPASPSTTRLPFTRIPFVHFYPFYETNLCLPSPKSEKTIRHRRFMTINFR